MPSFDVALLVFIATYKCTIQTASGFIIKRTVAIMPDVALDLLSHDKSKEGGPSALYATKCASFPYRSSSMRELMNSGTFRDIDAILREHNTNLETGLSDSEVDFRKRLAGPNELISEERETLLSKFIDQFKNPMILLLLGSAAISAIMGEIEDAISITLVGDVCLRSGVG